MVSPNSCQMGERSAPCSPCPLSISRLQICHGRQCTGRGNAGCRPLEAISHSTRNQKARVGESDTTVIVGRMLHTLYGVSAGGSEPRCWLAAWGQTVGVSNGRLEDRTVWAKRNEHRQRERQQADRHGAPLDTWWSHYIMRSIKRFMAHIMS